MKVATIAVTSMFAPLAYAGADPAGFGCRTVSKREWLGHSTEPHLHFHVCDAPDALRCAGIPVKFENVEIPASETMRQIQSGDVIETLPPSRPRQGT